MESEPGKLYVVEALKVLFIEAILMILVLLGLLPILQNFNNNSGIS